MRIASFFWFDNYKIRYKTMKVFLYGCKPWVNEEDSKLKALHFEHWKISEIAMVLNRTVEAIRHRKKKLKLGRCLKMDAHNIVRRRKKRK